MCAMCLTSCGDTFLHVKTNRQSYSLFLVWANLVPKKKLISSDLTLIKSMIYA